MLGLITFLPPMSLHLVPSREAWIAFVIKAVKSDNVIAPIRIHIIPNKRPQRVFRRLITVPNEKKEPNIFAL